MSKIYVYVITLLTVASLAFATEEYQLSWSSQQAASQPDLKIQAAGFGLPDSVLQIKNVRANIDLDKDGKMEFMVPVMWEDADGVPLRSIYLYENTGNDRYDMVWSYTFPDSADQFVTVDVSDLDGDGMLEILAVNVRKPGSNDAGPNLYVFENVGDNDYGTEPTITWDLGNSDRDVVRVAKAADLDGDGKQEVVMTAFLTQPAIVIASVSDFTVPVWTTEYINNEIGGVAPDIAAIGIGDMDNDGTPEVVLTEGATDKLLVIEATAANTYGITEVDIPVAGKTVSVHSIEMGDVNGDDRDEAYIANLQGTGWVVSTTGDAAAITTGDIHAIAETEEQWLEAGLGDLGLGGFDFVIAGSNGSNAVDFRYIGGVSGDVTDPANYVTETIVDEGAIESFVPGGVRVYGLDFGDDMDGDGLKEIVFTRGSTRGGKDAPAIFILEVSPSEVIALIDSVLQIKNVRANIDLDKDGKKEFMVPVMWKEDGYNHRSIIVYENSGNNQYDQVWKYDFPDTADQFVTVDVSDLDGDGMLEILAVNVRKEGNNDAGPNLYVFENVGDNDYGTAPTVTWDLGNSDRDVVRVAKAADLDGDGKQEVIMTAFLTQPAIVIASVSDFTVPIWTTEYINNEVGGVAPDIAAIGIGDMDGDGTPEVVLTEGATDKLLVVEATAVNTYSLRVVDIPVAGKTVSVHSIEMGDVDGDGKDEAFIANLQGTVWVVSAPGDALAITSSDIHAIAETEEQWLEAGLGNLGLGGQDFVIAASNASKAVDYRYMGGDVTDPASYKTETLIDSAAISQWVPGGIRVYGLDFGGDMDNDGLKEVVFTRGSTRGGELSPCIFIIEMIPLKVPIESDNLLAFDAVPDSVLQIKNVRANIDMDKDGKMEFMVPVMWEDADGVPLRSIYLYENTGDDAYDMVWSYTFPDSADQFVTVDVSDLDGDGNLEILAVNVRKPGNNDAGPNLYVFEYKGTDNDYGTEPTVTWDLGNSDRDVVRVAKAADLDGDGKQEVVMTAFLTQPAIVIASVSDFTVPVWTTEYINNEVGGVAPDIAAIGIGDMDGDGTLEVVLTEGATDKLLVIEATAANTYGITEVSIPVAGKTVSVHSIEMGDINGDGRDEAFIANLQGTVWVVTAPGDAAAITSNDIHAIVSTEEQWLEAGLGDLGLGGVDFVIAGSNASNAVDYRYTGGSITSPDNYVAETLVDLAMIDAIVPGGIRVYGLDFGDDMDKDGKKEIIFTRGSTRGGKGAPSLFILELTPRVPTGIVDESGLPSKFALHQNYPNPFNPSTTIVYDINKPSQVVLNIYDVLGRKVITLVNEFQTSKSYKIVWNGKDNNGRNVATGIYFYRLKTDFGTFSKRMNYIR